MSATAKGDDVILSSWFTGTVQVIDRKTGKTREMMHGFKAPHDAVRLGDGSFLVNELGSGSLLRVSGEHGADRTPILGGLAGPVGLAATSKDAVYLTEALAYLECRLLKSFDFGGDHDLYVAEIVGGQVLKDEPPFTHVRGNGFHY